MKFWRDCLDFCIFLIKDAVFYHRCFRKRTSNFFTCKPEDVSTVRHTYKAPLAEMRSSSSWLLQFFFSPCRLRCSPSHKEGSSTPPLEYGYPWLFWPTEGSGSNVVRRTMFWVIKILGASALVSWNKKLPLGIQPPFCEKPKSLGGCPKWTLSQRLVARPLCGSYHNLPSHIFSCLYPQQMLDCKGTWLELLCRQPTERLIMNCCFNSPVLGIVVMQPR